MSSPLALNFSSTRNISYGLINYFLLIWAVILLKSSSRVCKSAKTSAKCCLCAVGLTSRTTYKWGV